MKLVQEDRILRQTNHSVSGSLLELLSYSIPVFLYLIDNFNWSEFIARKILKLWIFWWIHYENNLDLSGSIITFTFISFESVWNSTSKCSQKTQFFLFIFFICWLKEHRLYINNTNWLRLGVAQTGQWVLTNCTAQWICLGSTTWSGKQSGDSETEIEQFRQKWVFLGKKSPRVVVKEIFEVKVS